MELLLRDRLAESQAATACCLRGHCHRMQIVRVIGAMQITNRLLPELFNQDITGACLLLTRLCCVLQAHRVLLSTSGRILVAIFAEHLELIVNKLGRADLNRMFRLKLV